MKALVCVGPPDFVTLTDVPAPFAERGEAIVDVEAISVNRGEVHRLIVESNIGWRPGWDFAGTVRRAPGGTIPPGSRVCGMTVEGSWAEQVAVPVAQLARVPDDVGWELAAALPVAGLTALRTLRLRGDVQGQSVLVLGAAGGVGRFAVQLASRAGASVTAVVGGPGRGHGLRELGAEKVVHDVDCLRGRYDLILESVGGETLRRALELVAPGGLVVCFGNSAQADTALSISDFYPKQAMLRGFYLLYEIIREPPWADLSYLLKLCANGELRTDVASVDDWTNAPAVLADLRARRIAGKAVLRTRSDDRESAGADA
jgi:NADPH:quinone reductase-like Zn-dependent oxidoreductase